MNTGFDAIYEMMRDAKRMLDQSPEGSLEQAFYRGRFHAFAAALDVLQDIAGK